MTQGMDGRSGAADAASRQVKRRGRIGLFLPYVLLAIVVLGWSGAWFWIRGRAEGEMDAWLAREAAAGRTWTCQDRSLTGFPFRLELRCAAVTLSRSDGSFRLGPATAVAQIYQPRLVLFESQGPFHVEQGGLTFGEPEDVAIGLSKSCEESIFTEPVFGQDTEGTVGQDDGTIALAGGFHE